MAKRCFASEDLPLHLQNLKKGMRNLSHKQGPHLKLFFLAIHQQNLLAHNSVPTNRPFDALCISQ